MCTPSGGPAQGQITSNRADIKICRSYKIDLDIFLCDWRDIKIYYDKSMFQDQKVPLLVEVLISIKWPPISMTIFWEESASHHLQNIGNTCYAKCDSQRSHKASMLSSLASSVSATCTVQYLASTRLSSLYLSIGYCPPDHDAREHSVQAFVCVPARRLER